MQYGLGKSVLLFFYFTENRENDFSLRYVSLQTFYKSFIIQNRCVMYLKHIISIMLQYALFILILITSVAKMYLKICRLPYFC